MSRSILTRGRARRAPALLFFWTLVLALGFDSLYAQPSPTPYWTPPTNTPTVTPTPRPRNTHTPTPTKTFTPTPGPPTATPTPTPTLRHLTIRVPQDAPSIQTAIDYAEDGDTVVLAPGVYYENIHFKGKNILIRSTADISSATTVDWRIVDETIIDGGRRGSVATLAGTEYSPRPGVQASLAALTIRNGSAENGGGVNGNGGQFYVQFCNIHDNYAARNGGGVFNCQQFAFVACKVWNNVAGEYGGGGAYLGSYTAAWNSLFYGNRARYGGALAYSPVLTACTVSRNRAEVDGGGLYNCSKFDFSIVWGNEAGGRGNDAFYGPGSVTAGHDPLFFMIDCVPWTYESVWSEGGYWLQPIFHIVTEDPKFVDPDNGDFHLSPDSPVIDEQWLIRRHPDLDGNTRPVYVPGKGERWKQIEGWWVTFAGEDIGCYEYQLPLELHFETATPTPTPPLPGDVLRDGRIDYLDLFELSMHWQGSGETSQKADLNYDGIVDAADLLLLIELMK